MKKTINCKNWIAPTNKTPPCCKLFPDHDFNPSPCEYDANQEAKNCLGFMNSKATYEFDMEKQQQ